MEWAFPLAAERHPEYLDGGEHPDFGAAMFVDVLGERSLEDMAALLDQTRPDLVVYDATDVGAGVAAAAATVPAVCHSLSKWIGPFRTAMAARMSRLWAQAGVDQTIDVTVGDLFLDIWPPSMQDDEARRVSKRHQLLRPVPWSDPQAETPGWLAGASKPLVFVSLGTMFWGRELLGKVIEGLAGLDVEGLILAGADATREDLPTPHARLRVAGFVNQAAVFPYANVVVHHGGAGTLLGSLVQGLPQLVLPEGADRPYTAASLEATGAGLVIDPKNATAEGIAGAVRRLLDDAAFSQSANELRDEIAGMPSPGDVVGDLEELAT